VYAALERFFETVMISKNIFAKEFGKKWRFLLKSLLVFAKIGSQH
jgi:hypothetical protein